MGDSAGVLLIRSRVTLITRGHLQVCQKIRQTENYKFYNEEICFLFELFYFYFNKFCSGRRWSWNWRREFIRIHTRKLIHFLEKCLAGSTFDSAGNFDSVIYTFYPISKFQWISPCLRFNLFLFFHLKRETILFPAQIGSGHFLVPCHISVLSYFVNC